MIPNDQRAKRSKIESLEKIKMNSKNINNLFINFHEFNE